MLSIFVGPETMPITQSRPLVQPTTPPVVQSREGSATFKEYVERTITRMRDPPQEPPMKRSCTAMSSIPIQAYSFGTFGVALRHKRLLLELP